MGQRLCCCGNEPDELQSNGRPTGVGLEYLAGAVCEFPHVDQRPGLPAPPFKGKVAEHPLADTQQFKNRVWVCHNCGKPNAYTMVACNQCGSNISQVEVTATQNVFMGFIYGIEKGNFPLTVSLRYQSPELIIFDDLMALCPCHVNVVPTSRYIPDLRHLLAQPAKALLLIRQMRAQAWAVVQEQFLANADYRRRILHGSLTDEQLGAHLVAGFNLPPSQSQLHMQCMLPPFTPFQYTMCVEKKHFGYGRFFTYEYMEKALLADSPLPYDDSTLGEDVIEHFNKCGVYYNRIHNEFLQQVDDSHNLLKNWSPVDFKYKVTKMTDGPDVVRDLETGQPVDINPGEIQKTDKLAMQNYGRPFNASKPTGSYYEFARKPEQGPLPEGIDID